MVSFLKLACSNFPAFTPLLLFAAWVYPDDPDLGYHLAIGGMIVNNGRLPESDPFRIDAQVPELAYSWLPDATLYLAYQWAGVAGLRIWVLLSIFGLITAVMTLAVRRLPPLVSIVVLLLSAVALLQVTSPRPRLWATAFFAILLYELHGAELTRTIPRMLRIWALTALWANTHISAIIAPLVVLLYGAIQGVLGSKRYRARAVCGLFFAAALGALSTPYGIQLLALAAEFSLAGQRSVASEIVELRGVFELTPPWPAWLVPAGVLALLALTVPLYRVIRYERSVKERIAAVGRHHIAAVAVVLCCAIAASGSSRHTPFLVMASVFALLGRGVKNTASVGSALTGLGVAALAVGAGLAQGTWGKSWYEAGSAMQHYPAAALASAEQAIRDGETARLRILAPFGRGHFVSWWLFERGLSDRAGVILDGRTDRLGRERFALVSEVYADPPNPAVLEQLHPDIVLAERGSALFDLLAARDFILLGGDAVVAFHRPEIM